MTIAELGSLGELIAALATVVTLAYLAVQIIASNEDLWRIYAQGLADPESLNPIELARFRMILTGFMAPPTAAYKEWQLGITDEAELLERPPYSRAIFGSSGGQCYWRDRREMYDPGRQEEFDSHLF